jgi:hypothetical protein
MNLQQLMADHFFQPIFAPVKKIRRIRAIKAERSEKVEVPLHDSLLEGNVTPFPSFQRSTTLKIFQAP